MANLKVVVIEGADHMSAFTKPEFLGELKAFFGRQLDSKKEARAGRGGGAGSFQSKPAGFLASVGRC